MVKLKIVPKKDLDYVDFYAKKLRQDNKFFNQQKILIDSQVRSSSLLFSKMFGEKNFKKNSRAYLRERKLIEPMDI